MALKSGLGKGLSALISNDDITNTEINNGFLPKLPIGFIEPNRYQPRIEINPENLVELSDSIRELGIIEPILVTKRSETSYELIAGERRWRAAQLAGLETVPVVVKEATPKEMLEMAVVENIQREDLNPFEEAMAFDQLMKQFSMTHEDISQRVGINRSTIANKIRLLALPDEIKKGILENKIAEGHARALLGLNNKSTMIPTYDLVVRNHLSVRAVEELVRRLNKGKTKIKKSTDRIVDEKTTTIEKSLQSAFGKDVKLSRSKRGGKIVIPFRTDNELDKLIKLIL